MPSCPVMHSTTVLVCAPLRWHPGCPPLHWKRGNASSTLTPPAHDPTLACLPLPQRLWPLWPSAPASAKSHGPAAIHACAGHVEHWLITKPEYGTHSPMLTSDSDRACSTPMRTAIVLRRHHTRARVQIHVINTLVDVPSACLLSSCPGQSISLQWSSRQSRPGRLATSRAQLMKHRQPRPR